MNPFSDGSSGSMRGAPVLVYAGLLLSQLSIVPSVSLGQGSVEAATSDNESQTATFAGGCFWCMEPPFDKMDGVLSTTSGYTGGRTKNPRYEQVKTGRTGHIESMQVKFDPTKVSYEQLLWLFWHNVDPTRSDGQFCDKGNQYRPMIFYHNAEQRALAEQTKQKAREQLGVRLPTGIVKATKFYPAEDYHQDYYKTHPTKYKFYRWKCGRDARLTAVWGEKAGKP
ncbi:MAG: peptide-methionine (S)-S-oxide reductase MsrA [Rubripirellula sp.]